ncbi:hypothetical protein HPP92_008071 [Vanilla planifolia]|uniref:Uncharacterized protein n=1 Tax=Vanilla planifolia TaxID=51239 RepID=A0A835RBL3_VANPL|nr:hypothetical protein HPP92_008071 [Vanilla planifolia]
MGRPVPEPPQLLQVLRPDPAQVRHPTSPSDHREQKQSTLPVPLQVGQRGPPPPPSPPDIGGRSRPSTATFSSIAPATTPSPVANTWGLILSLSL